MVLKRLMAFLSVTPRETKWDSPTPFYKPQNPRAHNARRKTKRPGPGNALLPEVCTDVGLLQRHRAVVVAEVVQTLLRVHLGHPQRSAEIGILSLSPAEPG